jgi:hypothetical protein
MLVTGDQSQPGRVTRQGPRAWIVLLVPAMLLSQMFLQHMLLSPYAYHSRDLGDIEVSQSCICIGSCICSADDNSRVFDDHHGYDR